MPVFIFNNTGLIEERPDSDWKQVGSEVRQFKKQNPGVPRNLLVGPAFPPEGQALDTLTGKFRQKTFQEKIDSGEMSLPSGFRIENGPKGEAILSPSQKLNVAGDVAERTPAELVSAGLLAFDPITQKIENDQVVPKSRQELLSEGTLTYDQLQDQEIKRLRFEVEAYFDQNKTANGYRLDNLARQKAALTMQYRALPDTDPVKADLLTKQLIYTNAICDEILAAAEAVQAAYGQARTVVENYYAQQKTVAEFESVKITNYI
ncbi:MAG: hypothetical protein RIF32_23840 [Leptospirales bacterium]|jgi:hypothetical protein